MKFLLAMTVLAVTSSANAGKYGVNPFKLQPAENCERWADEPLKAVVIIEKCGNLTAMDQSTISYTLKGNITFTYINDIKTRIQGEISGINPLLKDSKLFFLRLFRAGTKGCSSVYNPCCKERNDFRLTQDRRVGDVGTFEVTDPNCDVLKFDIIDYQIKLAGPLNILGRSLQVRGGHNTEMLVKAPIVIPDPEE